MDLWYYDWSVYMPRWIFGTVIGLYLGTDGSLVL